MRIPTGAPMHLTINLEIMHELQINLHQYVVCSLIQMDSAKPSKMHQGWSSMKIAEIADVLGLDSILCEQVILDMVRAEFLIKSQTGDLLKPSPKWLNAFDYKLRLRSKASSPKEESRYQIVQSKQAENGDKILDVYDAANSKSAELFERFWYVWVNFGGTGNKAKSELEWRLNLHDGAVAEDMILAVQNYFSARGFDKQYEKSAENFLKASAKYWQGYVLTSRNRMEIRGKADKVLDQASGTHRSSFKKR